MFRALLFIGAGIGLAILMDKMVAVAVAGGLLNFAAGMIAFFTLRRASHALERQL